MTNERRPALFLIACGLAVGLLWGCASQSPEMGEAETAVEQGNYEAALSSADQALGRDSANTDAYLLKARVLRQMADSTMATDSYIDLYRRATAAEDEAVSVDPDVRDDVQEERQRIYEREIRRAERAYNRASKYEREEDFRRSIGFFGAAGATHPDSARPVLNEAYARLQVGQKKAVIPVLERYVERADTAEKAAYKILGELYVSVNEYEKATDLLDRATQLYPTETLQALRLNAYNRSGDVDEALAVYREQIERRPDKAAYRYNYGALLLKADRYADAIAQLSQAVELRPDNAEGQYNLGAAYLNAALARDDSIAAINGTGEAVGGTDGSSASGATSEQLDRLVQRRQELFENAIPPLERARALTKEAYVTIEKEQTLRQDACRALLVAYVQTDRPNRAAQVEDCTGFARTGR